MRENTVIKIVQICTFMKAQDRPRYADLVNVITVTSHLYTGTQLTTRLFCVHFFTFLLICLHF